MVIVLVRVLIVAGDAVEAQELFYPYYSWFLLIQPPNTYSLLSAFKACFLVKMLINRSLRARWLWARGI